MLEMNNNTMGSHVLRGYFFIIKAIKVLSKKICIFAHFVRVVTAVCLVNFGLRNKIEIYFYKPYFDQLNLWDSIVEITNKKFKMLVLIELYN